jgi:hypothetical protein
MRPKHRAKHGASGMIYAPVEISFKTIASPSALTECELKSYRSEH